jgi:predicted nucleotidyltransferase
MIADAHVDLLMELAYRERRLGETGVFAKTWLPLLERGRVGLQVCPVYVDVTVQPEGSLREALSLVAAFQNAVRENE